MCSVVAASIMKKDLYGLVIVDTAVIPPSKIPDKFDFKIKANNTYKTIKDAKILTKEIINSSRVIGIL